MSAEKVNLFHPDQIHLIKMVIIKCHIDSPFDFSIKKSKGHEFNMDFDLGFNLKDKLVKADFKLNVTSKSEGGNLEETRGDFHFVFIFKIENLAELAIQNKKHIIDLDPRLGNALASITYSTTRGILFTRLKGTSLEDFILPVIDPNSLLNMEKK